VSDTDSLSNLQLEAFHFIFQIPENVEIPPTEFKWEVPVAADGAPAPLRNVKYGYPKSVERFLEPGIETTVFRFEDMETPLFEASFPNSIRLPEFKQFLVSEIDGEEYDPLMDSIAIYKNLPGSDIPSPVPIEEYRGYGLTPYFSSNATQKYKIWVRRNRGIPEEKYRRSQPFMIVYQRAVGVETERHQIFTSQNPRVGDIVDQLVSDRVLGDPNVVVHRVLNYLIENRLDSDQRLFHGDNVLFITSEDVVRENQGEKVLRAVHAFRESDMVRLYGNPFFCTVILTDTCAEASEKLQTMFNTDEDESGKFSFMLGTQKPRFSQRALLHGTGTVADALAAQGTFTDPYLYVLHPTESKAAMIK
jgi:hypothetical protein